MNMLNVTHQEHCLPWYPSFLGQVELVDAPQLISYHPDDFQS